jgi:hypothetical protein
MIKWIGQHIVDFIARFRSDVYLESLANPGSDTDKFLVIDANNKVGYRAGTDVLNDIGATSSTGDITGVDLTGGTGIEIASETNTTSGDYSATINCDLEGTELKSTDETGTTKFLRVDGDGSCSWQVPSYTTNTNTQNTTTLSFVDSSDDIILRNTTGGAGSGTDDIKFVAGSNITLTHTDADNITIAAAGGAVTSIVAGDGIDVSGATGDVTVTAEDASATNPGIVELATTAETTTGTDTTRAVTPDGLKDGYQGSSNVVTTGALNSGSITSGFGNIDIGSSTFDTTGAVTTGILQPVAIKHVISGNNAGDYGSGAEILYNEGAGTGFTTGAIYVLRAGTWNAIDCSGVSTTKNLCAVALGSTSASGMLIKGCVTLAETYEAVGGGDSGGAIVYGSATDSGRATLVAPTSSGHFVRILGYSLNVSSKKMFFNPDSTYVEIA